jgi:hypothetical protein
VVIIAFFTLLILINIVFAGRIGWWIMVLIDLAVIAGICLLVFCPRIDSVKLLAYIHDWYVALWSSLRSKSSTS